MLLIKDRLKDIPPITYDKRFLIFIVGAFSNLPLFFLCASSLVVQKNISSNLGLLLASHFFLLLSSILLIPGVFGTPFIVKFFKIFKRELGICAGLSAVFYVAIWQVWKLWPLFSGAVLNTVRYLMSLTFPIVQVFPPRTLLVQKFAVSIEQSCSGLDSIFLFTCLYILIVLIDRRILNITKVLLVFIPALIGLFMVNILRVYLLVLIGVLISPQLAATLFHTYAGMVLFIVYFLLFLRFVYGWMKK
jgi:exosortase/archaeosortase family protein